MVSSRVHDPLGQRSGRPTARLRARTLAAGLLVLACLALGACGSSSKTKSTTTGTGAAHAGGSMTVLLNTGYEGAWPTGLDPATNTNGAANQDLMNSIYGNLFELGAGGTIIPDLASGYSFADGGKTLVVDIRPGVKFTDGTPFNAQAVAFNIKRDIASPCSCSPKGAGWPLAPTAVTTPNATTVELHYLQPFAPAVHDFIDSDVNWIASPSALTKLGDQKFKITPVGAGPFEVVSDTLSSQLVLKKNPGYWEAGHPLLSTLYVQVDRRRRGSL